MILSLYVIASACLLVLAHSYLLYPLSLRLLPGRPVSRSDGSVAPPTATLLFSAFNEERSLPAKIENLAAIKALHPDLEIIAYSDCSTDRTNALLAARADLLELIVAPQRTGKASGMRLMVERAKGEICIFTDANVLLEPEAVARLLSYFSDPHVGGVCGTLHYINGEGEGATARVGGAYWRLEEKIKKLESRSGSVMGADGSIFAMRRSLYPRVPAHLLDDMIASFHVLLAGQRLVSADDVIAFEKSATVLKDELRRKRRIGCRAWLSYRHLAPKMRAGLSILQRYQFLSHKLLRWFGGAALVGFVVAVTMALLLDGRPTMAVGLWIAGGAGLLLGFLGVRPFAEILAALLSLFAALMGVFDAWRGRTYQIWAPVASRD